MKTNFSSLDLAAATCELQKAARKKVESSLRARLEAAKSAKLEVDEALVDAGLKRRPVTDGTVTRLYEQIVQKMDRNMNRLVAEEESLRDSTSSVNRVLLGLCSLVRLMRHIDEFLKSSFVYKRFVDDSAKQTKQFDSFSDIIGKFNSLQSVCAKSSEKLDTLLQDFETNKALVMKKTSSMLLQINLLLIKLSNYKTHMETEQLKIEEINSKLWSVRCEGVDKDLTEVKAKLCKESMVEQLAPMKKAIQLIDDKCFEDHVNFIKSEFATLKSVSRFNLA